MLELLELKIVCQSLVFACQYRKKVYMERAWVDGQCNNTGTENMDFFIGSNKEKTQVLDEPCTIHVPVITERKEILIGDPFDHLPDHVTIDVLVRLPVSCWVSVACVRKKWASLFRSEMLWQLALEYHWPCVARIRKWPGPIGCTSNKRCALNSIAFSVLTCLPSLINLVPL